MFPWPLPFNCRRGEELCCSVLCNHNNRDTEKEPCNSSTFFVSNHTSSLGGGFDLQFCKIRNFFGKPYSCSSWSDLTPNFGRTRQAKAVYPGDGTQTNPPSSSDLCKGLLKGARSFIFPTRKLSPSNDPMYFHSLDIICPVSSGDWCDCCGGRLGDGGWARIFVSLNAWLSLFFKLTGGGGEYLPPLLGPAEGREILKMFWISWLLFLGSLGAAGLSRTVGGWVGGADPPGSKKKPGSACETSWIPPRCLFWAEGRSVRLAKWSAVD